VRSTVSVEVAAPPELVFAIARDVERWPRLLPHYVRVDVEKRQGDGVVVARMVARRTLLPVLGLGLPVAWRSRSWNEPEARRLRFVHLGGATNGMDVTWRIEPADGGCHVSIEHDFRPRVGPWAPIVDRFFTRPIAGRTLATFKALAEALAEAPAETSPDPVAKSARPSRTNQPA
jgi:ribosome-associated toxin RatA of RatAB toxin-antitoxin module